MSRCWTTTVCKLVADVKTKIYRITAKDPAALPPLATRVVQLKYASTTNMTESVQATFTDKRSGCFRIRVPVN
ncbi:MAG: hypothetical protein WDN00_14945 [Limisphaerales bacterium]